MNKQFGSQLLVSEDVMQVMDKKIGAAATNFGCVALKGWHKPVTVYKLA
ncbi:MULTISPECIES: nucleotidyl cyclase domain-containing protein [Niastella]